MSWVEDYNKNAQVVGQVTPFTTTVKAKAPAPKGNKGGLLSRLAKGVVDPLINTGSDVSNAIGNTEVRAAHALGLAKNVKTQSSTQQFGDIPVVGKEVKNNSPKQFAGNVIQTAATVAPIGKAPTLVGNVIKGAKVGAAAGTGSALANDQNVLKGAVEGAVTGGAGQGILSRFTRASGATSTVPGNTERTIAAKQANGFRSPVASGGSQAQKYGTDLLGNKLNVGTKDAERFQAPQTVAGLQRNYGMTVHQAAQLHPVITGGDGASTEALNGALETMGHTKFSDFGESMKHELNDPENLAKNDITDSKLKNLNAVIDKYHQSLNTTEPGVLTKTGKAAGVAESGTNAKAAMDIAKRLEGEGHSNITSASDAKQATGEMQLKMADFIKSRIYNAPGGEEALNAAKTDTSAALRAEAESSGNPDLHKIADAFDGVKSFQDFRNVSAPFVNARNLVHKSNLADFANTGSDRQGGIGQTILKGASKVVSPVGGKVLSNLGNRAEDVVTGNTARTAAKGAPSMLSRLAGTPAANKVATVGVPETVANPYSQGPTPADRVMSAISPQEQQYNDELNQLLNPDQSDSASGAADEGAFTQANLLQAVAADPKHASTYISLYSALKPPADSKASTTGKVTAQQKGLATSGLSSLQALAQEISSNPNVVTKSATPGQSIPILGGFVTNKTGAADYETDANHVLDSLARLQTGAAMSKSEEKFYRSMLPKPGDNPDTIQNKLTSIQTLFSQYAGSGVDQ